MDITAKLVGDSLAIPWQSVTTISIPVSMDSENELLDFFSSMAEVL